MNKNPNKIYNSILKYLKDNAYISDLRQKLSTPEKERFNAKKIFKYGLDISDAVHCVYDKNRSIKLMNSIKYSVKEGDTVLEAGSGTGILSLTAVYYGAKVWSIEINKNIMALFKKIYTYLMSISLLHEKKILFKTNDAIKFKTDKKFDVIISENLYTGMFYEKQVDIMNNLVSFLKKGGAVIPSKFEMGLILTHTTFPYQPKDMDMFVVLEHEKTGDLVYTELSSPTTYDILDFSIKNKKSINKKIDIKINKSGVVNSILVWSKVVLPDGNIIDRSDTIFLNNDIILALTNNVKVVKGETISMEINYKYGCNPTQARFIIKK